MRKTLNIFAILIGYLFFGVLQINAANFTKTYSNNPPPASYTTDISLCPAPYNTLQTCWNSERVGVTDCGDRTTCTDGNAWSKYETAGCLQENPNLYDIWYQYNSNVCSTADKCDDGAGNTIGPYLKAGYCECTLGGTYKTCCSNGTPSYVFGSSCVQLDIDNHSPYEGVCPAGSHSVFCGFTDPTTGTTYPPCGQEACGPVPTPSPTPSPPPSPTACSGASPPCSGFTQTGDGSEGSFGYCCTSDVCNAADNSCTRVVYQCHGSAWVPQYPDCPGPTAPYACGTSCSTGSPTPPDSPPPYSPSPPAPETRCLECKMEKKNATDCRSWQGCGDWYTWVGTSENKENKCFGVVGNSCRVESCSNNPGNVSQTNYVNGWYCNPAMACRPNTHTIMYFDPLNPNQFGPGKFFFVKVESDYPYINIHLRASLNGTRIDGKDENGRETDYPNSPIYQGVYTAERGSPYRYQWRWLVRDPVDGFYSFKFEVEYDYDGDRGFGPCAQGTVNACTLTPGTNQLKGCLFKGQNFDTADGPARDGNLISSPVPADTAVTALDQTLVNWNSADERYEGPNSFVGYEHFSAKWAGYFNFGRKNCTFNIRSDDGVRFKINGVERIDNPPGTSWKDQGYRNPPAPPQYQTEYTFPATSTPALLELEYYQDKLDARVSLDWTCTPYTSSWIQATGDVHSNDRIAASGGPGSVTYSGLICPFQTDNPRVLNGLISSYGLSDNFGNREGFCVVGDKATLMPYTIPTYEDLKSIYFTQSKANKTDATPASGTADQGTIRSALNSYDILLIRGNLDINGNLGGAAKTAVVFVDGDLSFGHDFTFGNANSGLVFVVKGNVNIHQDVTQIDAVIISDNKIYTAGAGCATSSVATTDPLVVNGSLISLNGSNNIKFCRTLSNNNNPAEKIIQQPKYLVILRNLFSQTYQKWKEIP